MFSEKKTKQKNKNKKKANKKGKHRTTCTISKTSQQIFSEVIVVFLKLK
jgi:hypothetical protein